MVDDHEPVPVSGAAAALQACFEAQRAAAARAPAPDWRLRVDRLARIEAVLREGEADFCAAVAADFGRRSADETRLLELFPSLEALKHARRQVRGWMRDRSRRTSLWFTPGASKVVYQPLGVAGIVVPWNYPLFLSIAPLAGALAAGNRIIVKMSELVPRTGGLLAERMAERFDTDEVAIVNGDVELARAFTGLPFDALLFTGSTSVGRQVMRAAAEHLTPVTLELGGKSPAIVAPGVDLGHAAQRIMFGKLVNAGQTCIAPDYVLLPRKDVESFARLALTAARALYPDWRTGSDYSTIISSRHFSRLERMVDEAVRSGAILGQLGGIDAAMRAERIFPPTIVTAAAGTEALLTEEIFGPVLPVVAYDSFDDAIRYVNARPRPLALYLFDDDRRRVDRTVRSTASGGVTVNDVILHIAQDDLPFGGVGASGMGQYHGFDGFKTFSKEKAVFTQSRINAMGLFKPPYGRRFRALVRLLMS